MGDAAFQWVNECIATGLSIRLFQVISICSPDRSATRTYVVVHGVLVKHYSWSANAIYGMIAYYSTALHYPRHGRGENI